MRAIEDAIERLSPVLYGVAAVALIAIVVLMNLRIVSRNLDLGLSGLQLYAQALSVWMIFVVAGVIGLERRHIEIDYFTDRLPEGVKPYHDILVGLVSLLMCGIIVAGGVLAIQEFWTGTSATVNIPMPLYYVPVVVGVGLLGLLYVSDVGDAIRTILARRTEVVTPPEGE